jgi:hypothetical protein
MRVIALVSAFMLCGSAAAAPSASLSASAVAETLYGIDAQGGPYQWPW